MIFVCDTEPARLVPHFKITPPVRQHHNQVRSRLNNRAKKIMRKEQFYANYNGAFNITGAHFECVM